MLPWIMSAEQQQCTISVTHLGAGEEVCRQLNSELALLRCRHRLQARPERRRVRLAAQAVALTCMERWQGAEK